jgi:hypothetical protein
MLNASHLEAMATDVGERQTGRGEAIIEDLSFEDRSQNVCLANHMTNNLSLERAEPTSGTKGSG